MKRLLLAAAFAVLAFLFSAACGDEEPRPGPERVGYAVGGGLGIACPGGSGGEGGAE